jgi:hypothetical protein
MTYPERAWYQRGSIEAIKIFDLVPGPALITISLNSSRL